MYYVKECTFKMFHQTQPLYLVKPLIWGIEFCFLHAKLVTESVKVGSDCRITCREKEDILGWYHFPSSPMC